MITLPDVKIAMSQPTDIHDAETLLREVRAVLTYHRCSGIESYPAVEGVTALLRLQAGAVPRGMPVPQKMAVPDRTEQRGGLAKSAQVQPGSRPVPATPLSDILEEVRGCTACRLSEKRIVPVAGGGGEKAKLLIVGDWMVLAKGHPETGGCVFGIEQDRMLGRMLEAINMPREEVFVTNVIKCGIPGDCQPRAEHVHACLSFLLRQMVSLQPTAILSMGLIATRTLLKRKESLSTLRGQLQVCHDPNGRKIPLIATYHPTFLLQNPEMKRATWQDLQLLAKQLGLTVKQ